MAIDLSTKLFIMLQIETGKGFHGIQLMSIQLPSYQRQLLGILVTSYDECVGDDELHLKLGRWHVTVTGLFTKNKYLVSK